MASRNEPSPTQLTLAKNMKRLRKELGLSQMQLAERCGVSTSFIGEIEICRKFPTTRVLESIAMALDSKTYLLIYDGDNEELQIQKSKTSIVSFAHDLREKLNAEINELTKQYLKPDSIRYVSQVAENPPSDSRNKKTKS